MNMKKNKIILSHCKNFYKIKNFDYDKDDYITDKIVSTYEEYIFNIDIKDDNNLLKIEKLDYIIGKYIDDYTFRKEIKNGVLNIRVKKGTDIFEAIVNALINLFEKYEEGYTRNIYFSRWI